MSTENAMTRQKKVQSIQTIVNCYKRGGQTEQEGQTFKKIHFQYLQMVFFQLIHKLLNLNSYTRVAFSLAHQYLYTRKKYLGH